MTNPKPSRNQLCAICGHEYFDPGNWRYLDPDAEKKELVHKTCYNNMTVLMMPLQDQVEMLEQEVSNLRKQLELCPPVYKKCVDGKPTDQGQYLVHCQDGRYTTAMYLMWCSQWLDDYQQELQVIEWMPIPR